MAGIYFHIPFCKQACHYCDFHFSTSLKLRDEMLDAMHRELALQSHYLGGDSIETIYFGGGTPSMLSADEIQRFVDGIADHFVIQVDAEITLEANPDDLDQATVQALKQYTAVNRFSIGIQSFFEEDLRWMNRAHDAGEAQRAIGYVQDAGYDNVTADLIFGYPLLTDNKWQHNIERLVAFGIPHISAYGMTVEPRTALATFIRKGKQQPMNDDQSAGQFEYLMDSLETLGYEQYEISNFAKPGRYARHNSNYWKGVPYLGIGPSAHTFNGRTRQWNVRNNARYIEAIQDNRLPFEQEELRAEDQLNEYIMTTLRTVWGVDLNVVEQRFGPRYAQSVRKGMQPFVAQGALLLTGQVATLTRKGKLLADHIAAELFVE